VSSRRVSGKARNQLRIALIAAAGHPIREPFAGGLEAFTWALAAGLRQRGHSVSLFAAKGSDPRLGARDLPIRRFTASSTAAADVSMPAADWLTEHHAYLSLMLDLTQDGQASKADGKFDVVHNNSLHHLPVAMARLVTTPQITTLHTPPTPWLESAVMSGPCPVRFVAVSRYTADAWAHAVEHVQVVANGVDTESWRPGPGGGDLVWFGRLVAEKAPHLAIAAARRAGVPMQLAGPISDRSYFDSTIAPMLGRGISYLGHLKHAALVDVVGRASATLVTPRWDEPYGLVAAESLACGTPVIGFARGGIPEVVDHRCAALVRPDDIGGLADAITARHDLDRRAARERAERHCSVVHMVDQYEHLYAELAS
jgi:glycosyltransferase involved in cell wall biosynthesis